MADPKQNQSYRPSQAAAVQTDRDRMDLNMIVGRGRTIHHDDKTYGQGETVPYTRREVKDGTVDRMVKLGFLVPTNVPDKFVSMNGEGPETNIVEEGLSKGDGPSARVA